MVDNDRAFLRSMELLLSGLGHRVRTFIHPGEASAYLAGGGAPDVLLLDYAMPQMNGLELLSRIAANLRDSCRVIMITGHMEAVAEDARWRPQRVAEVLFKPLDGADILEALARASKGGNEAWSQRGHGVHAAQP